MRVALFLKNEKIKQSDTDILPIIVLNLRSKNDIDVEKEIIVRKDINYLSLWLLTKKIKEIYVVDVDPMIKKLFEKLGITVKKHREINKNPILKEFLT